MNIFSLFCGQLDDSCSCLIYFNHMIQKVYPVVMKIVCGLGSGDYSLLKVNKNSYGNCVG